MHTACSCSSQLWVGGGGASASVHAKIHPRCGPGDPLVLAWRHPLGVDLDTLPQARPRNFPLGVGLETPQARPLKLPLGVGLKPPRPVPSSSPLVWAWRHPPQVWAWRPPKVWAWRPPRPDPSTSPLGVGLEIPPGQTPQLPPVVGLETPSGQTPQAPSWVWAWRHHPRCGPGDPPRPDPSTSPWLWAWRPLPQARPLKLPLGVDMETCKACWDTTPPETCKTCWDTT